MTAKRQFDANALRSLSYGMYIVSSNWRGKLNGQTANVVFLVTIEPEQIAVCINKDNLTHEYIEKSGVFAVSVLSESMPMDVIRLFGFKSGRETDKLAKTPYKKGITGSPLIIENTLSVIEVEVKNTMDLGAHTLFVGEIAAAETLAEGRPLTYAAYHDRKGRTSRNAPTFVLKSEPVENKAKGAGAMKKYVCDVCGYEYDPEAGDPDNGISPGTSFEDLPDDWVCPLCSASKDEFTEQ